VVVPSIRNISDIFFAPCRPLAGSPRTVVCTRREQR
jgi:hypothetical protein